MNIKVKTTNAKGIKKLLSNLKDGTVDVGILSSEGKHKDSSLTVAQIGFIHEFGAVTIPERSFIRSTINENAKEIKKVARDQYLKVLHGKIKIEKGLGTLGAYTAGLIQEKFTNNDWEPNTEATQARKGSSKPLINTGQLRQSISFKVNA